VSVHEVAIEKALVNGAAMRQVLVKQREAALNEGHVSADVRIDRLRRGLACVSKYQQQFVEALNTDFGCRPRELSLLADVAGSVMPMQHALKHLRQWMKPQRRKTVFPLNLLGGRCQIEFQPLGVVGIISPWNYPLHLTFSPLADVLAAGNRALIKPSELTPSVSEVMVSCVREAFDSCEVDIFTGGIELASAFCDLSFDHLVFTGSTSVGRQVMVAAAKNLVPVTLELGGKSPVLIGRSANMPQAVERIVLGKMMNSGQTCIAPDYLLLPEEALESVIVAIKDSFMKMYPSIIDNPEYTSVINARHLQRLQGVVAEARQGGASVVEINPAQEVMESSARGRKMPLTLIVNPVEGSRALEEEIFGPILPIKTYKNINEAIDYVNHKPHPLALYYFGCDRFEERMVLNTTCSGSVCVNDVVMQVMQENLPFGGVGPSGMGAYHGEDGFKAFSHAKSVYRQSRFDVARLAGLIPPYGKITERTIRQQTKF